MFKPLRCLAWATRAIAASLLAAAASPALAEEKIQEGEQRVIITYKSGQRAAAEAAVRSARGVWKLDIEGMDAVAAVMPKAAVAGLSKRASVFASIEPDVKRYRHSGTTRSTGRPYAAGQEVPYGISLVQADKLQARSVWPAAVRKVCIIDSGIDATHEDLAGNEMTGEYDSGTGWWYTDENGHGTHVAGTIAALNNRGIGVVGVVPNGRVSLHVVKVFGEEEWAYSSTLISAANKCRAAGANIISMSLGGPDKSRAEEVAFGLLALRGVLVIASAGNAGDNTLEYPASYLGVMSVAAIDEDKQWADFSQFNRKVEIAAPGVNVYSTVPMGTGNAPALTVGTTAYDPGPMDGSPRASVTAALADFGIGDAVNAAMAGKICLIKRGTITFGEKVAKCQASGGVGAVVFNNIPERLGGAILGDTVTTIPSVTASGTEGAALLLQLGQTATVGVAASNYGFLDGTSMATPYVSGVAALVWGYFPECTALQIRAILDRTAEDLGSAGRDRKTGFGLVRAKAAYDRIERRGCNG